MTNDEAHVTRRLSAWKLAETALDDVIRRGRHAIPPFGTLTGLTLELADWLLADGTVTDLADEAEAHLDGAVTLHAELDAVNTSKGEVARRQALRHLATVANDVFAAAADLALEAHEAAELNSAIDDAYAALDWPRYPETEATR